MAAFRRVAAYAPPGAVGLGLGLTSAIFRPRTRLTAFDLGIFSGRRGLLPTDLGVPVLVEHGPELLADADLILMLPGASFAEPPPASVIEALRAAHERGATLAAHCLGVFGLAATGLLDDLEVTTHWQFADRLVASYPRVRVRPQALYRDHGSIVTGAGAATGATPHAWLLSQRLSRAEELLETTTLPIEQIADQVGYRSAAVFREQFTARRGIAPRDYRRTFRRTA